MTGRYPYGSVPGHNWSGLKRKAGSEVTRFADNAKFMQNIKEGI